MSDSKTFFEDASRPRREVLDRLREEIVHPPQQPDEFTITEVAKELEIEYKKAEYRIRKMERQGILESRKPGGERYFRYKEKT
jgi:DNA-binding transcriptional ArsR family regulator